MAKFVKTNITKYVDYTDSHCNHSMYDSDDNYIGKEHEDSKIEINISGNTRIYVNGVEIATKDCSITETCPENDVVDSNISVDNLNLKYDTNLIVSDGFTTHTGETFSFNSNEYVNVDNINIGSNVTFGPNIRIGNK